MPARPDKILEELGIIEPKDIDLDAIAWHLGAKVKYRALEGCEARIIGSGDRAVISINNRNTTPARQRFSLAHELGHWMHHRGQQLPCETNGFARTPSDRLDPERVADQFASGLLMPTSMIQPMARRLSKVNFKAIREIAEVFGTSLTATTIRLIEGNHLSGLLVCHTQHGRKWFTRARSVSSWFPRDELSQDSFAFDILFGGKQDDQFPRKIGADAWFDRGGADRYEIQEQTIRVSDQEVVTLLIIDDDGMLSQ